MTPRTEIVWLKLENPIDELISVLVQARYSYYPEARGSIDHPLGLVQSKDLLSQCVSGKPLNLEEIILNPLFLPENLTVLEALEKFRESRSQIAFIIDEFGGVQGISTITDILEAIAGDFPDAIDTNEPEVVAREDGTFLIDGMLDIHELKKLFDLVQIQIR